MQLHVALEESSLRGWTPQRRRASGQLPTGVESWFVLHCVHSKEASTVALLALNLNRPSKPVPHCPAIYLPTRPESTVAVAARLTRQPKAGMRS